MTWDSKEQFGYEALGPIVNHYLAGLHSRFLQVADGRTCVLHAMRAGLRIWDIYDTWCTARGTEPAGSHALLRVSRIMAMKAAFKHAPDLAAAALDKELGRATVGHKVNALMRPEIDAGRASAVGHVEGENLAALLQSEGEVADRVKAYLSEQAELYLAYLQSLAGDADRLVLVDSGWRGTSQLLLEHAAPQYDWEGLYFGCIGRATVAGTSPRRMHGLVFDRTQIDPRAPETRFLAHRHLIESLFEPGIRTIESVGREHVGDPGDVAAYLKDEKREEWDGVYDGVKAYVADNAALAPARMAADYERAIERMGEILCFPSVADVDVAEGKRRSHDLGREGAVTAVFRSSPRFRGDTRARRVHDAIWPAGQAALEADDQERVAWQERIYSDMTSRDADDDYFTSVKERRQKESWPLDGKVAIITRTKDRPVLLRRAAKSVADQTYSNYVWVVVNDGGDPDIVQEIVRESLVDPRKVKICSNAESLGMEAASNVGIGSVDSDFIVIHDDDDSWDKDFLKETVDFLTRNASVYQGVVTHSTYVSEEITDSGVVEHNRVPYKDWVDRVDVAEMVMDNMFPPIAFLFTRAIYDSLNGFDEELPVLGDWDFNLRFLLRGDIGVLPKKLAYYHHRDVGSAGKYANSVTGGVSKHVAYSAIVRNKMIRRAGESPEFQALAVLVGRGYGQQDMRGRLERVRQMPAHAPAQPVHGSSEGVAGPHGTATESDRWWIATHLLGGRLNLIPEHRRLSRNLNIGFSELVEACGGKGIVTPPPDFDEQGYLRANPDVANEVRVGAIPSGYNHFIRWGAHERRQRPTCPPRGERVGVRKNYQGRLRRALRKVMVRRSA
jgi:glycosyltransferase involved in cell wall biosynthesis